MKLFLEKLKVLTTILAITLTVGCQAKERALIVTKKQNLMSKVLSLEKEIAKVNAELANYKSIDTQILSEKNISKIDAALNANYAKQKKLAQRLKLAQELSRSAGLALVEINKDLENLCVEYKKYTTDYYDERISTSKKWNKKVDFDMQAIFENQKENHLIQAGSLKDLIDCNTESKNDYVKFCELREIEADIALGHVKYETFIILQTKKLKGGITKFSNILKITKDFEIGNFYKSIASSTNMTSAAFSSKSIYKQSLPKEVIYQENINEDLVVSIIPNKGVEATYYEGEKIFFTLSSNKDCRFIIRHIAPNGQKQQLYPRFRAKNNFLQAGVPRVIPEFNITVDGSEESGGFGFETIEFVVSDNITYDPQYDNLQVSTRSYSTRNSVKTRGFKCTDVETGSSNKIVIQNYNNKNNVYAMGSITIKTEPRKY